LCDFKYKLNFQSEPSSKQDSPGRQKLKSWLNKNLKIEMTDGRVLVGIFLCTDRDANIILGSCSEYLQPDGKYIETYSCAYIEQKS
jgi:small nuclear ribonucleoprotein (snRNP)-like protein